MSSLPLELLFLTQTFPRFPDDTSGPFIRDLARGLVRLGDRVTVLTPHTSGLEPTWNVDGVEVRTVRYAPGAWEVLGYGRSLRADETLRGAATAVTPLYLAALAATARRLLSRRSFDLVHAHWIVPNGIVAPLLGHAVPVAVGLHGSDVFVAEKGLFRPVVRRVLSRTALLTGCSPELVERICRLGFPAERSRVIPYGVDVDTFRPGAARGHDWRAELGIPANARVVLTVGRMVSKKGYDVLVASIPDVLREVPEAHFVLAGDGDRRDEWRRQTDAFRDRVHFPGAVLRDRLPDLYRSADLFVLPAVHDRSGNVDGLPNVILEAMASGLPVVASAISGIPLAVRHGREGSLVAERDEAELRDALVSLLREPVRLAELGVAARHRAEEDLTWDRVAAQYREAYRATLAEVRGGESP